MRRAATMIACLALACFGDAAPAGPPRSERVSVQRFPDGSFVAILRGASEARFEGARDVAVDAAGNAIVVGGTESPDFPTTPGAHQTTFATGGQQLGSYPEMDVFVTKLGPDGSVLWSTFLGGPNYDRAYAVEVDDAGAIYVGGRAGAGFPTTPGVVQPGFAGDDDPNPAYGPQDGFVAKLGPDGVLQWATYLGDPSMTFIRDIDVDAEGHVHAALVGRGPFPHVTPGAWQSAPGGADDDAVVKLGPDGRRVIWATLLGRSENEGNPSIRVDDTGRVFVLTCSSSDGWVAPGTGFQSERGEEADLLLVRLSRDGAVEASTYLGGSGNDVTETHHLALDPQGRPALAVFTTSRDLPLAPGTRPYRAEHGPGEYDGYAALLSADLDALIAATYIGTAGSGGGFEGIGVDARGQIAASGVAGGGLQTTAGAVQSTFGGDRDAFVVKFSPGLDRALYLTYWGDSGRDNGRALAVNRQGDVVAAGWSQKDVLVLHLVTPQAPEAGAPTAP